MYFHCPECKAGNSTDLKPGSVIVCGNPKCNLSLEVPSGPNEKANIVPPVAGRSVFDHRPNPLEPKAQPEIPPAPEVGSGKPQVPRINLAAAAILGLAAVTLVAIFIVTYSNAKLPPPSQEFPRLAWPAHLQPEMANQPYPQPDQLRLIVSQQGKAEEFINRGTYSVICRDASRKEIRRGAGFAIGADLVVSRLSLLRDGETFAVMPRSSSHPPEIQITTALAWDAEHDLVILELPAGHPAPAPLTLECLSLPFVGDKVYHLSHPDPNTAILSEGAIRSHAEGPAGLHHILFDSSLHPQTPGGPLVNGRGAVVGILEDAAEKVQAKRRAIPVAALWELLSRSPKPVAIHSLSNP